MVIYDGTEDVPKALGVHGAQDWAAEGEVANITTVTTKMPL
jgi:hypothetical protein